MLAGCGQILGLGDYEVGEEASGSGGSAGTAVTNGGDSGSGGGGTGGSAGADGGMGGMTTTTSGGGDAGTGGGGTTSTSTNTGMGGAAGGGECTCDPRDPCLTGECDDAGECIPREVGAECLSGNFGGVCDDTQQCVPCVDDAPDTAVDSGCPETAPECDDSGAAPECAGCTEDIHCDDGIDCTEDSCDGGRCSRSVLPAGAECSEGVCIGAGVPESCVPCVNNQGVGLDAGCEAALPVCDASESPALCVECLVPEDCDDDNDCTIDTCEDKQCGSETVPAGEECLGGICSGIPGSESCGACLDTAVDNEVDQGCTADAPLCDMAQVPPACTGCDDNTDCDDEIDCTTDTCNGSQVCVHEPDDSVCEASADVCNPNQCVPGEGCIPVDVTQNVSLLANGSFDDSAVIWNQLSTEFNNILIVDESNYVGYWAADSPTKFAWLGNAFLEQSSLSQVVTVPEGTQSLTVSFMWQLVSDELPSYPEFNLMGAELLSGDGSSLLYQYLLLGNSDANNAWEPFTETIDATSLAGSEVMLHFWFSFGYYSYYPYCYNYGYPDYDWVCSLGITNFFVDTTALTATVCQ